MAAMPEPEQIHERTGADVFLDHIEQCHPEVGALVVAQSGSLDEQIAQMVAEGWTVERVERVAGKRVHIMNPPAIEEGTTGGTPRCGRCGRPFNPSDPRWDGSAQYQDTPYCRSCIDRCHESTDFAHQCVICRSVDEGAADA